MKDVSMVSAPRPLLDALSALRDVPPPVGQAEHEARRRARIAARVVETHAKLQRQSKRRLEVSVWLVAAFSLGGWLVFWLTPSPTSSDMLGTVGLAKPATSHASSALGGLASAPPSAIDLSLDSVRFVLPGLELLSGDLREANSSAFGASAPTWIATERSRIRLSNRVELELEADTQLRVVLADGERAGEEVEILRGRVHISSNTSSNAPVAVRTETVRVNARGARFSVSYTALNTGVEVATGSVQLERSGRSHELHAGQRWRDEAGEALPSSSAVVPAVAPEPREGSASLAEENRMFQSAMLAKQRGLGSLAVRRLDEMLSAHPRGPLGESARVERFRILERAGNTEGARVAAQAYLARHPSGFARAEAERLLAKQR